MPLDPRFQALVEQTARPQNIQSDPMEVLARQRANTSLQDIKRMLETLNIQLESVAYIEDRVIPGPAGDIPIRLYTPHGAGPFPILVFFHGGGWIAGNLETHDPICRSVCHAAGCLVLSVDNRLAPEHKFPAGVQDCYAATCWMATHATQFNADPTRIAVAGDSAGGNFAAAVAQMSRDQGGPALVFQLLLWPPMGFRLTTASWKEYNGYMGMTSQAFTIVRDLYLNSEEEQKHPYAAPLLARNLHGLPPALIITAECDPLRDGGEQYGQRLSEAGVPVTVSRYDGMLHGFMHMKTVVPDRADQALAEVGDALRRVFAHRARRHCSSG
ncbi:MAG: alpha/beta hydrolase [Ktedonobacteraceae bacterium]|nr:alpha/beta hydrolase [Ktedonobacteraceae bacterium]